jgi:hypothetical protein
MSVSMTKDAVIARTKTVTRRKGWAWLQPGTRLTLVEKAMGLKKGETVVRLAEVEVVSVRREQLQDLFGVYALDGCPRGESYPYDEMVREGFPGLDPLEFIRTYFVAAQGMVLVDEVTRIEWRYLDDQDRCLHCDETRGAIRAGDLDCATESGVEYREIDAEWDHHRFDSWTETELAAAGIHPTAYTSHRRTNISALQWAACTDTVRGHIRGTPDDVGRFVDHIGDCIRCGHPLET